MFIMYLLKSINCNQTRSIFVATATIGLGATWSSSVGSWSFSGSMDEPQNTIAPAQLLKCQNPLALPSTNVLCRNLLLTSSRWQWHTRVSSPSLGSWIAERCQSHFQWHFIFFDSKKMKCHWKWLISWLVYMGWRVSWSRTESQYSMFHTILDYVPGS